MDCFSPLPSLGKGRAMSVMVKGYKVAEQGNMESLYAWHPDGEVYACRFVPVTHWFNKPNRRWVRVRGIPRGAEFIGNYRMETM
jgi:hypothetical protein